MWLIYLFDFERFIEKARTPRDVQPPNFSRGLVPAYAKPSCLLIDFLDNPDREVTVDPFPYLLMAPSEAYIQTSGEGFAILHIKRESSEK